MKEEAKNHNHIPALKEHALKTSIREGASASISTNLGDGFIIPFALILKAQPIHIGILSSFSSFLYQIAQLLGIRIMEKHPRKKIVISFVLLQAIMWLFIALTSLLVWKGIFDGYSIWMLIAFYSIMMFLGGIAYPAWFSWMGDIVPEDKRGAYFSDRNRVTSTLGLISALFAAFILDYYKTRGYALIAFSALFALAFLFKFGSFLFFHKQFAPKFKPKKRDRFSFWAFIKRFDNFGKFAAYHGLFNFAVMIASPFFTVYMLQELNFSYTMLMIATVSYTIFYLIFLPIAGRFSDRYGNRRLTIIMNIFFAMTPILYMFVKTPLGVILLPQLTAGIAGAASIIAFTNFTYDSVSQKHRGICITYTNIISGVGSLLGAMTGGLIVNYFHPSSMNPFIFVFAIAAALRLSVSLFLFKIKEVRKVKRLSRRYNLFFHPLHSMHTEVIKVAHMPGRILGKFKSLRLFTP